MSDQYDDEQYAEEPAEMELDQVIDRALNRDRPARYLANDRAWMDSTVQMVADELETRPHDFLDAARRRVHQREGIATRSANRVLREVAQQQALPIGWGAGESWLRLRADLLRLPLSIGGERVRLGEASPSDLQKWLDVRRREAAMKHLAEEQTWRGAELLISWAEEQGVHRVEDLRQPVEAEAA